jgi:hypothetical protein
MSLRPLLGAVLLFVLSLLCAPLSSAQRPVDIDPPLPSSERQDLHATDRENAGLRGPVSVNIEEGLFYPGDSKHVTTTKYSPDGKLLTPRTDFTSVPEPAGHVEVRYDEQGIKTTIQTFDSKTPVELSHFYGERFSPWDSAAQGGGVPEGGNVTTLYDQNNQAAELQIRGADGTIILRFVRTYNANGRVTEEKMIWENPAAYILDNLPEIDRDKKSPEELKHTVAIGSFVLTRTKAQMGAFYTFDEQNRLVKTVERNEIVEKTTTITYNDHGDKVETRAIFADIGAIEGSGHLKYDETGNVISFEQDARSAAYSGPPRFNGYTVRYVYQYDSFGNWIQRTSTVSHEAGAMIYSTLDDPPLAWHRTLSYYQPSTDK